MISSARIVGVTKPIVDEIPDAEGIISYAARVSNPSNQTNFDTAHKLLAYCAKHHHWSVFETCNVVMEIHTPRDIARQILRHRSFSFQEFSQRYAESTDFVTREARLQDTKNRQNSIELSEDENGLEEEWEKRQLGVLKAVEDNYKWALDNGIAKESARVILPEGLTMSSMYMNGTVRSWMHYTNLRGANGTQKEHQQVAEMCKDVLQKEFPSLANFF